MKPTNMNGSAISIDSWFDDYETVTLPSGKKAGLRQVDILHILSDDGSIPNFLLDQIAGQINGDEAPSSDIPDEPNISLEDLQGIQKMLDRLVQACWAYPPVSDDPKKIEAREAIAISMISLTDKMSLLTWAMGGATAFQKAGDFLAEQVAGGHHRRYRL